MHSASVIANVDVDYVVPVSEIGALLARLIDDADAVNPGSETATGETQEDGMTLSSLIIPLSP